jgi:hypothetical protein
MCYSAQVSLITAGYLALAGIWSLRNNRLKGAHFFAAIPLIFAAQQAIEGLLWLAQAHHLPFVQAYGPYAYLFFAFLFWPIYVPFSIYMLEPLTKHNLLLRSCIIIGILTACVLFGYILCFGAQAEALSGHIHYIIHIPYIVRVICTLLYLSVTVLPFFCTSVAYMPLLGFTLLASYIIAYFFYYTHIVSLWCFFAALLSGCVCIICKRVGH